MKRSARPDPPGAGQARRRSTPCGAPSRAADQAGVELSEWEGEFLGSVAERVATYGRAFGDPEKGAPGAALSARQGVKLKEIVAKAKGEPRAQPKRRGFARKPAAE